MGWGSLNSGILKHPRYPHKRITGSQKDHIKKRIQKSLVKLNIPLEFTG
jgi:hypothetical protein